MTVLFDHQVFSLQRFGGISRYFYELMRHFSHMSDMDFELPLAVTSNVYMRSLFPEKYREYPARGKKFVGIFQFAINSLYTLRERKKHTYDVFHPTYYFPYFHDWGKPLVVTIHDMIPERFPGDFRGLVVTREWKRIFAHRADKIIAVSENTKKDIVELYGIKEEKIVVIHHGISFSPEIMERAHFTKPVFQRYVLFVGVRRGYKNFERMVKALAPLIKKDLIDGLVCVGGGSFEKDEEQLFSELGLEKAVVRYDVSDEELAFLYKNAAVFVFPSLYEGFGFPLLEAFASECPVCCSLCSSFPEVAGEAAYYFDPYSEESMRESVEKVLGSPALRQQLINKGKERLKLFSWEKTAQYTKKVYEEILGKV
ncbi:glycosyltransferase family 4 protein [Thermospira aquatica]|uniref:Glycosyltransferase family 4 protein n=1 Tax=Thermospira aquatica TaxID=2828656 RepID=A0AAX3BF03_9SPIR|nr:glycosyltransferase family 1 protein [Thermospira aquatica]URA10850.1 glycosyltransferase family 4 protein [Thermospira aquatica]